MSDAAGGTAGRKTRHAVGTGGTTESGAIVTFTCGCGRTVDTVNGFTVTVYVRRDSANVHAPSGRIERDMCVPCMNRATLLARASGGTLRTRPIGVAARHRVVAADRRTGKPAVSIVQRVPAVSRGGIVERDDIDRREWAARPFIPVACANTARPVSVVDPDRDGERRVVWMSTRPRAGGIA